MSDMEQPKRLSISEETLRLQLSELELRLKIYFDQKLGDKAGMNEFRELAKQVDALDRGDFTPVHRRALLELIEEHTITSKSTVWTKRERLVMVVGICFTFLLLALNVYVAVSTSRSTSPTPSQVSK